MDEIPDILKKIINNKLQEITERSNQVSLNALSQEISAAPLVRNFVSALRRRLDSGQDAIIAEIKRASPSKGVIRADFDPIAIAINYERAGAACLSVLTEQKFFQGSDLYLQQARDACSLPILRKDFIVDVYQVYESRCLGADCILLIVAALGDPLLRELAYLAEELGMSVLVEVHNEYELSRALTLELATPMIGINNRDLKTFNVDLNTTCQLISQIPSNVLVITESGILNNDDVILMHQHRINAFLVGEALMRAPDPGAYLQQLFNN